MAQLQNRRRHSIMCWGYCEPGHLRSNCPRNNKNVAPSARAQLARYHLFPSYNEALLGSLGLYLRNGNFYRKWESDDGKRFRWQLILPNTRVSTVLKELHGSPTGGHLGVMKTLHKVRERFYWNNVRSDVEKCCRTWNSCASRKGHRKRTRGRLQLYNVGVPLERIAFDILGPFPRSSEGNNNILVVMDYFTKWSEAYPVSDQETSTVANAIVQHWISRFVVPLQLHSDKGRNFDSTVCKRLCRHRQPGQQLYILSLTAW
ncbi:retrovirus-related Pol polyprotein from transposon 412 [Trichonephila clavipes]|nr:retrovirus-related Pol polyprotein from transposon 412 [Trichonephila clavipes]